MHEKLGLRELILMDRFSFSTLFLADFRRRITHTVRLVANVTDTKDFKHVLIQEAVGLLFDET